MFIKYTPLESFVDQWKSACNETDGCNAAINNKKWSTITGMNYPGNDITSVKNSTPEKCQSLCASTSGCKGALISNEVYGNTCWLKNELTPTTNPDANLTFYIPKSPDANWTTLTGMNYGGNDITSIANSSKEQCQSLCASTSECIGALLGSETYNNTCWIKNDLTPTPNVDTNLAFYIPKTQDSNWTKVSGMDYGGNDLSIVENSSTEQCQSLCASTSGCAGALVGNETYGNKCWLKSKITDTPSPNTNLDFYIPK